MAAGRLVFASVEGRRDGQGLRDRSDPPLSPSQVPPGGVWGAPVVTHVAIWGIPVMGWAALEPLGEQGQLSPCATIPRCHGPLSPAAGRPGAGLVAPGPQQQAWLGLQPLCVPLNAGYQGCWCGGQRRFCYQEEEEGAGAARGIRGRLGASPERSDPFQRDLCSGACCSWGCELAAAGGDGAFRSCPHSQGSAWEPPLG